MKRETLRHPKTFDLAARLGCSRPEALGYLTLLWDFTAEQAIQGNVGKWPDGSIARSCDWTAEPSIFVSALVSSGWLDRDPEHRLLVHDWAEHCERWVHAKLNKVGKDFAEPTVDRSTATLEATAERSTEPTAEPSPPRDQTKPNRTKPPPPPTPSVTDLPAEGGGGGGGGFLDWDAVRRRLAACRVGNVATALRAARDAGLQPMEVLELAEHWEAAGGAWEPGALHWRICQATPGGDPKEGWPPPKPKPGANGRTRNQAMSDQQAIAHRIVRAGRRKQKPDEEIQKELQAAGLEWP